MRIPTDLRAVALLVLAAVVPWNPARADERSYPLIEHARHNDPLYRQQQEAVQEFYVRSGAGRSLPQLQLFRYVPQPGDSLIQLAARFNVPYSSLATLNRIQQAEVPAEDGHLLIPSLPGIFVPENPHSDLERLLHELRVDGDRSNLDYLPLTLTIDGTPQRFRFYPGDDFDRVERLAFLNVLFRRPLQNVRISSPYGYRRSPFSGRRAFHSGVDFVAPLGTAVHAAREGTVSAIGFDPLYGNFVLLDHHAGFQTFYGHLDQIAVQLNDPVSSGMIIGTVGNSGLSTGPHLHFEIRLNGETRDPALHMPGLRR
ncbi:MAG: M23 family metallopeptidase [Spirochaetaceae bacterium]|nr:MAG: M23 family metallopeptidase [Spirochaetaceae bacterium]